MGLVVLKTDGAGEQILWEKGVHRSGGEIVMGGANSFARTADGGCILAGATSEDIHMPSKPMDIYLAKLSPESPETFERGHTNGDGDLNLADAVCLLSYLFGPAGESCKEIVRQCLDAADANDDGAVDVADAIAILSHLFAGAGPLPEPFGSCGIDPTNSDDLDCLIYDACP